jgi:hypothetical protein
MTLCARCIVVKFLILESMRLLTLPIEDKKTEICKLQMSYKGYFSLLKRSRVDVMASTFELLMYLVGTCELWLRNTSKWKIVFFRVCFVMSAANATVAAYSERSLQKAWQTVPGKDD